MTKTGDIRAVYQQLPANDKARVRDAFVDLKRRLRQSNSMAIAARLTVNDGHAERYVILATKCIDDGFLPY